MACRGLCTPRLARPPAPVLRFAEHHLLALDEVLRRLLYAPQTAILHRREQGGYWKRPCHASPRAPALRHTETTRRAGRRERISSKKDKPHQRGGCRAFTRPSRSILTGTASKHAESHAGRHLPLFVVRLERNDAPATPNTSTPPPRVSARIAHHAVRIVSRKVSASI